MLAARTNFTKAAVDSENDVLKNKVDEYIEIVKKNNRVYNQLDWENHEFAKLYFDIDKQINENFEQRFSQITFTSSP